LSYKIHKFPVNKTIAVYIKLLVNKTIAGLY